MSTELHNSINRVIALFHSFRLWRSDDESELRKFGWNLFHLTFYFTFFLSLGSGAILSLDWNEAIFLTAMAIVSLVTTVKLTYILWKKQNIVRFLRELTFHSIEENKGFSDINKKLENFWKFIFWYLVIVVSGVLCIFLLPIILRKRILPLSIGFPLNWKQSDVAYGLAYAHVVVQFIISIVITLLNVIIWYVMLNCSVKYEILGQQFKNMGTTRTTNTATKIRKDSETQIQNLFLRDFITLFQTHQHVQETIKQFKSCFSNLFLVHIVTSGIGICGSVYILVFASDGNLFQHGVYVALLLYDIFDIFMVTYLGNEIKYSSNRLSYCLFESNWIELPRASKMDIIILTEFLIKPYELVIFKLYPMNLETFTSILNFSYSMFKILRMFK